MADTADRPEMHAIAGALHSRQYLLLIGSSMHLLSSEMGQVRDPTPDQHREWTEAVSWLAHIVERAAVNLDSALGPWDEAHDASTTPAEVAP